MPQRPEWSLRYISPIQNHYLYDQPENDHDTVENEWAATTTRQLHHQRHKRVTRRRRDHAHSSDMPRIRRHPNRRLAEPDTSPPTDPSDTKQQSPPSIALSDGGTINASHHTTPTRAAKGATRLSLRALQGRRRTCCNFAVMEDTPTPQRMSEALAQAYDSRDSDTVLILSRPAGTGQWDFSANGGVTWKYLASGGGLSRKDLAIRLGAALDGYCDPFAWMLQDHEMVPEAPVEVAAMRLVGAGANGEPPRRELWLAADDRRGVSCVHEWPQLLADSLLAKVSGAAAADICDADGSDLPAVDPAVVAVEAERAGAFTRQVAAARPSDSDDAVVPLLLTRSPLGRWRVAAVDLAAQGAGGQIDGPGWVLASDDHNGCFEELLEHARSVRNFDDDDDFDHYLDGGYLPFPAGVEGVDHETAEYLLSALDATVEHGVSDALDAVLALQVAGAGEAAEEMAYDFFERAAEHSQESVLHEWDVLADNANQMLAVSAGWATHGHDPAAPSNDLSALLAYTAATRGDPDSDDPSLTAALRAETSIMLSEASEALRSAETVDGLDAALTVAEDATIDDDDQGMVLLADFYRSVQYRLTGTLVCHHDPALDVMTRTLHTSTVKAARGCLIEAVAATCCALLATEMSGDDPDEDLLDLVTVITGKASRGAVPGFGLGGSIFVNTANRLQRALDKESHLASHRAAVTLLAICQLLRTIADRSRGAVAVAAAEGLLRAAPGAARWMVARLVVGET